MPRNMSFAKTTQQMYDRTKTVTRRFGWWFLKRGDLICAVEKGMGLKKGEKVKRIGLIRIVHCRPECTRKRLSYEEIAREGFPGLSHDEFMSILAPNGLTVLDHTINRIEFEHVDEYGNRVFAQHDEGRIAKSYKGGIFHIPRSGDVK